MARMKEYRFVATSASFINARILGGLSGRYVKGWNAGDALRRLQAACPLDDGRRWVRDYRHGVD